MDIEYFRLVLKVAIAASVILPFVYVDYTVLLQKKQPMHNSLVFFPAVLLFVIQFVWLSWDEEMCYTCSRLSFSTILLIVLAVLVGIFTFLAERKTYLFYGMNDTIKSALEKELVFSNEPFEEDSCNQIYLTDKKNSIRIHKYWTGITSVQLFHMKDREWFKTFVCQTKEDIEMQDIKPKPGFYLFFLPLFIALFYYFIQLFV